MERPTPAKITLQRENAPSRSNGLAQETMSPFGAKAFRIFMGVSEPQRPPCFDSKQMPEALQGFSKDRGGGRNAEKTDPTNGATSSAPEVVKACKSHASSVAATAAAPSALEATGFCKGG